MLTPTRERLRNALAEHVIRALLIHDSDEIASYAAIGVWVSDPKSSVPDSLQDIWPSAILRGSRREYWLGEVFKESPDLAYEFLRKEVQINRFDWSRHDHASREALDSLSTVHRRGLLHELPENVASAALLSMLIANDTDAYKELISIKRLEHLHTAPLRGKPSELGWLEKATTALDAGIEPKAIAMGAFTLMEGWRGKESDMWNDWIDAFQTLKSNENEPLSIVADIGIKVATVERDKAIEQERNEETYRRP